jgi:hypothetical protein
MATNDELHAALTEAATKVAAKAANASAAVHAELYASAARQLVEAVAWLRYPNQSHGSNASTTSD